MPERKIPYADSHFWLIYSIVTQQLGLLDGERKREKEREKEKKREKEEANEKFLS